MPTQVERVSYGGWPNCWRLSNGLVELIATADVGPRLIRFGFAGGDNEFAEYPDALGQTGGDSFRLYGGHRLWHAPEAAPRSYAPDNNPVQVEGLPDGLRLTPPLEAPTGIQKEIIVRMAPDAARLRLTHRLRNDSLWPISLSPWALSVMAPGGAAILPLPPRGPHPQHLSPSATLVLWPYTDLSDPRFTWGRRSVLLRQRPASDTPQKIGSWLPEGWLGYANRGRLFVKRFSHQPACPYPDLGCSAQLFTDGSMLEVESLGPLTELAPGQTVEHEERWALFDGVATPASDDDVERDVRPLVDF